MPIEPPVFSKRFQIFSRFVVIFVLWLIIGSVAIGKAGIANYMVLLKQRDLLKETNWKLKLQNQDLTENIHQLKKSPAARFHFLRDEFGYVASENEYVYRFH